MALLVETHPDRDKIIDALLAGESLRTVGERYSIAPMTLHRFKAKVVRPAVLRQDISAKVMSMRPDSEAIVQRIQQISTETKQAAQLAPVLARLGRRAERREKWMASAEDQGDYRALNGQDSNEFRDIELECKLTGLLSDATTVNNTMVAFVCMAGQQPAAAAELGQVLEVTAELPDDEITLDQDGSNAR